MANTNHDIALRVRQHVHEVGKLLELAKFRTRDDAIFDDLLDDLSALEQRMLEGVGE